MILQCSHIGISFDGKDILKDCTFHMEDNSKTAIVGANGAGKTTLLKIITGEYEAENGTVSVPGGVEIGYLKQLETVDTNNSIYDEVISSAKDIIETEKEIRALEQRMKSLSGDELQAEMDRYSHLTREFEQREGYALFSHVTGILKGLGFSEEEFRRSVSELSGGQKTRVALGRLLLRSPSLIILDEPTNHLDLNSVEWLEGFLKSYKGAVLIVSHDRYFLDRIVDQVVEIENGVGTSYKGNYSDFAVKKEALREARIKAYLNQQAEIKHSEEVIAKLKQFNREKSIKRAESREKALSKVDRLEKVTDINNEMHLKITPAITSGNDVLSVTALSKSYPDNPLFKDIDIEIKRGERVALIGNNGTGKTTLLKILTGNVKGDSGSFVLGTNVEIGYYDQEQQVLSDDKTLFNEISDDYPDMNNTKIRNTLAAFLFTGDDVFKEVRTLSGGERGRLSLAKLMLSNANFLILDEPTNHLDMVSKEILEHALTSYEGTVFFVSHDRYFINKTATRILDLHERRLINFIGNYDYYLEKRDELSNIGKSVAGASLDSKESASDSENKLSWEESKALAAKERKRANEIKKIEEEIEALETRCAEIDELLSLPENATNSVKCGELSSEQMKLNERLSELYDLWEELGEA
ncbi:MAG: ABC-F type ribosomal protection protein [Lachnospiraceae bacterium]|nr:ABC-F type ribosomal protection protein [Lachnospiraceae bacterium]